MADRTGGYPRQNGTILVDGHGRTIGTGHKVNCSKIRPGAPGAWISGERCSYRFKIGGRWFACRGMGDEMAAGCRAMKKPPRGFSGARRRRRRRR